MIQYVVMLYRRRELTQEDFEAAWLGEHRAIALDLPGIVEAEFLPRVQQGADDAGPHGIGRLTFENSEALAVALASEVAARLRAHTATFADSDASIRMIAAQSD